jgi:hypothetical protein
VCREAERGEGRWRVELGNWRWGREKSWLVLEEEDGDGWKRERKGD